MGVYTNHQYQYDMFSNIPYSPTVVTTIQSNTATSIPKYGNFTFTKDAAAPTSLQVLGDAEIEGDLKIKGKSIAESLKNIEQRLNILHPNEELEAKWEKLKMLGDAYRKLEAEIIEKELIWETLKR